jgi:protein-S-isoprenylcysteine O-methyltransferase Ste14
MASQLVGSPRPPRTGAGVERRNATEGVPYSVVDVCVRRRVPISIGLFGGLILLDLFVFRSRPRDLFDWTNPLMVAGTLLVFFGLLVRTWAAGTLRKQRELATTGAYAFVRHPLYFGSFLMMVGFGTLVHDPITLWVVAGPVAWIYWQAINSEERQIARLFPKQWPDYSASVGRLFPRRLSLPRFENWSLFQWLRNSEYRAWIGSAVALVGIKVWQIWMP